MRHIPRYSSYRIQFETALVSQDDGLILEVKGIDLPKCKEFMYAGDGVFIKLKDYLSVEKQLLEHDPKGVGVIEKSILYVLDFVHKKRKQRKDGEATSEYLPSYLKDNMYKYQSCFIDWGIRNKSVLQASEMGCGKTLMSVGTLAHFWYAAESGFRALIICPSYLKMNWKVELQKWGEIQEHHIQIVHKGKDLVLGDIVIISYELAVRMIDILEQIEWNYLIIDECHAFKNKKSTRFRKLSPMLKKIPRKILASGTPFTNRPCELWSQLHILFPDLFKYYTHFAKRYCEYHFGRFGFEDGGSYNERELSIILDAIMIRKTKIEVLPELPEVHRVEIVLQIKDRKKLEELDEQLQDLGVPEGENIFENKKLLREKQALVGEIFRTTGCAKIPELLEYFKDNLTDEKTMIWCVHHTVMDALSEFMKKQKRAFARIDGKTSMKKRNGIIKEFLDPDSGVNVAILGLKAANTGLTMPGVTQVFFAETWFVPSDLAQAEARTHRIGCSNTVTYTYLLAVPGLDEKVMKKVRKKQKLFDKIVN